MTDTTSYVQLRSAQQRADGQPRYTLAIPITAFANDRALADYQAELAEGVDPAIRTFLDEELRDGDLYVDVGAGWGLHAFGAATVPGCSARVICVVADGGEAELLRRNASENELAEVMEVLQVSDLVNSPIAEVAAESLADGPGRIFLRIGDPELVPQVLARSADALTDGAISVVIWPRRPDPGTGEPTSSDAAALRCLREQGYSNLTLVSDPTGPVLVPIEAVPGIRLVFSLSPSYADDQQHVGPSETQITALVEASTSELGSDVPPLIGLMPPGESWSEGWMDATDLLWSLHGHAEMRPALFAEPELWAFGPGDRGKIEPALRLGRAIRERGAPDRPPVVGFPVLTWVGSDFRPIGRTEQPVRSGRAIAMTALEGASLDADAVARARQFQHIVVSSEHDADVLRSHGIEHVHVIPLIPDLSRVRPTPREGWFGDRFVVYSGGVLSASSGLDVVIAAFREFSRRHPDALLLACWQRGSAGDAGTISKDGLIGGYPELNAFGQLQVVPWLAENGIDPGSVVDPGPTHPIQASELLRESDVAIFPSGVRGGGGRASVLSLARGIPTITPVGGALHGAVPRDYRFALEVDGGAARCVRSLLALLEGVYSQRAECRRYAVEISGHVRGALPRSTQRVLSLAGRPEPAIASTSSPETI